jgi:hypothetical protein
MQFWFRFNENAVSFGSSMLPKEMHYTISYHPNDSFINLHVTKNTNDQKNKPQIKIVRISKEDAIKYTDNITRRLLGNMLKPFDITEFKRRNRNKIRFLPFDALKDSPDGKVLEGKLTEAFMPITNKKKSRVKIKGNIGETLENLATSKEYLKRIGKNIRPIPKRHKTLVEGGTLVSRNESISVIRRGDQWFEVLTQNQFSSLIEIITTKDISRVVLGRAKMAMVKLREAKVYQDVEKYNKSVPTIIFNKSNVSK